MPLTPQDFVSKWKHTEYVFTLYGWPSDLSDAGILEKLLALNLVRAKK